MHRACMYGPDTASMPKYVHCVAMWQFAGPSHLGPSHSAEMILGMIAVAAEASYLGHAYCILAML